MIPVRTAWAVLLISFLAAGCGGDKAVENLPQFSPPLGEPSPIVRGFFDPQDSSCETDGSQLRIAQNVQEVWMKGGFDYGQRSRWGGWELGGSVDDENTVHFEIEGRNTTLTCTATLLEPVFQGTCESTTSGSDFLGIGTCDFVFSRGAPREGVGEGSDQDGDGVPDGEDNCPSVANPNQADSDRDGRGDACDVPDSDEDGVPNEEDNCPGISNAEQGDRDEDGVGDACDSDDGEVDSDEDAVPDSNDTCPDHPNPYVPHWDRGVYLQEDFDDDGIGDPCDPDVEGDGIPNNEDPYNCRVDGPFELCPGAGGTSALDDDDGDSVNDFEDNCPPMPNPDQGDSNHDGIGDACHGESLFPDNDEDGVLDRFDNCEGIANPDQTDRDNDASGDVCDDCPAVYNPDQRDANHNGIGDVCEE